MRHQMVDNITHKNTKINQENHKFFGEESRLIRVVPTEFRQLVTEYPIYFAKNFSTNEFELAAVVGFDEKENLFLNGQTWKANYLPLDVQRKPFLMGFKEEDKNTREEPMVYLDADDPRVNEDEGEELFLEFGGTSPYMQRMSSILNELYNGEKFTRAFSKTLNDMELIESVRFEIKFVNNEFRNFEGLYVIHEEKLRDLDEDKVIELHKKGYLQLAHFMLASTDNISKLISWKNSKIQSES